jgi:hypothetical protein
VPTPQSSASQALVILLLWMPVVQLSLGVLLPFQLLEGNIGFAGVLRFLGMVQVAARLTISRLM